MKMSERFKFKAWDVVNEVMLSPSEFIAIAGFWNDSLVLRGNLTLLQSTGQRDSNGEIIFEGDVIRAYYKMLEEGLGVVQWWEQWGHLKPYFGGSDNDAGQDKWHNCPTQTGPTH